MKNSSTKLLRIHSLARAGLASALTLLLLGGTTPRLAAQSDDFNDGNDAGWNQYALPLYGAPTFSFPADDSGGKAYKMSAPPTGADPYGLMNSRVGSFRDEVYSGRFSVGADLLQWNATWRQEAGLLFYFQDIGLGSSDGYAATYSSGYRQLYISQVTDEFATTVAELGTGAVTLDPTHRYRLVASSHDGTTFLFQLFDKSQPNSPWASAIGQDTSGYGYTVGKNGLFTFEQDYPSDTQGAEATFDNYVATTPAPNTMPATVTDLSPPPARVAPASAISAVTVGILDRDTAVDTGSIVLCVDGVWIPNASLTIDPQVHKPSNPGAYPKDFAGATVTYPLTISALLPWGSQHTNKVAFKDNVNAWQTNTWTWTMPYPDLAASNSLPVGSLSVRGFDARMVQSSAANIGGSGGLVNSVASAKAVLAYQYAVDLAATNIVQLVAWDKDLTAYGAVTNFPGLCIPPANVNSFAIETLAYLQLTAGLHRFYVDSDDGVGIYSGTSLTDTSIVLLERDNVTHASFDFVVAADGLYPFHIIFEEGQGALYLVLNSVDLGSSSKTLVNDAGGVQAYYPLVCKSATSVNGPYTVDAVANAANVLTTASVSCDGTGDPLNLKVTGGTITVPIGPGAKFYRLDGPRGSKITNIQKSGPNVVITYQAY